MDHPGPDLEPGPVRSAPAWSAPPWPPAVPPPRPSLWQAYGRHLVLFLATGASIYLHGGVGIMVAMLSIMFAHEMGHYVACRIYGVDATLPFFIPFPVLSLVGTLG